MFAVERRLETALPFSPGPTFGHLVATAVPGVEEVRDGRYRRSLRLPGGPAIMALRPRYDHVACRLLLSDPGDAEAGFERARFLLDLDAAPAAVDLVLRADPALEPLVRGKPGSRVPRTVDPAEFALRVVIGQQISTAAARTHAGRLSAALGTPVADLEGGLERLFPAPGELARAPAGLLRMPAVRIATLRGLADALDSGELNLDPGRDRASVRARLRSLPGIGRWSEEMVAMRALGDPDVLPATDLGIRSAAGRAGIGPDELESRAERWRPFRSHAAQYLWSSLDHEMNRIAL